MSVDDLVMVPFVPVYSAQFHSTLRLVTPSRFSATLHRYLPTETIISNLHFASHPVLWHITTPPLACVTSLQHLQSAGDFIDRQAYPLNLSDERPKIYSYSDSDTSTEKKKSQFQASVSPPELLKENMISNKPNSPSFSFVSPLNDAK